jgi:putative membrane protein
MKNLTSSIQRGATLFAFTAFLYAGSFAQDPPKLSDPEIAHVGVTANQIDVNYGKLCLEKSKNKDVRHFAETMIKDHEGVIKQASDLAAKLGVTPLDNAMSKSLMAGEATTMKKLKALSGAAFDKAYIDNEVAYHKAVINAVKTVLIPQTQNAELKNLFVTISPVLDSHLAHAEMVAKEFAGGK